MLHSIHRSFSKQRMRDKSIFLNRTINVTERIVFKFCLSFEKFKYFNRSSNNTILQKMNKKEKKNQMFHDNKAKKKEIMYSKQPFIELYPIKEMFVFTK